VVTVDVRVCGDVHPPLVRERALTSTPWLIGAMFAISANGGATRATGGGEPIRQAWQPIFTSKVGHDRARFAFSAAIAYR
jgi:hypothetical protein